MTRISQPLEVAKLKGADKKNPQRYRKQSPKSLMPVGNAPEHLSAAEKAVWFEIETYSLPGVLTATERPMMELMVVLFAEFRDDPRGFSAAKMGKLIVCMAHFGMTPAARQKLGVNEPKENEFENF